MRATVDSGDGRGRSRRAVLRAAGGVITAATITSTVAGCGLLDKPKPAPPTTPDALLPLLESTRALLGRYDAAIAAQPSLAARLTPIRAAHAEHVTALARLVGADPSAASSAAATGAPAATPDAAVAELRAAEQTGQREATRLCLTAPGARAPLLGSIVAARATHAAVLA
jgi:hypothetical protein